MKAGNLLCACGHIWAYRNPQGRCYAHVLGEENGLCPCAGYTPAKPAMRHHTPTSGERAMLDTHVQFNRTMAAITDPRRRSDTTMFALLDAVKATLAEFEKIARSDYYR